MLNIPITVSIFYQIIIGSMVLGFIFVFIFSLYKNRDKIQYYSLIARKDGKISKVGLAFLFTLFVIIYQAVLDKAITDGLIELMGIIIASELGFHSVDNIELFKRKKKDNGDDELHKFD